jgi:hypothetical protein
LQPPPLPAPIIFASDIDAAITAAFFIFAEYATLALFQLSTELIRFHRDSIQKAVDISMPLR